MNVAIKQGWIPATVTALVATMLLVPADAVTEIIFLVQIFALTIVGLLALSQFAPVASWRPMKRRLVFWSVAVGFAVLVSLEPTVLSTLRR